MNKTPWIITIAQGISSLLLVFLTYVSREETQKMPRPLELMAGWVKGDEYLWALSVGGFAVFLTLYDKFAGAYAFKESRVQRVLEQMHQELFDGNSSMHRVTLFKAYRGFRVWCILFKRVWAQDDWLPVIKEMQHINPFGLYLAVYSRPRKVRNPKSCAVYRVYRTRQRDCEGVAGLVWQKDMVAKRNVHRHEAGALRKIRELDEYDEHDPVRTYARETNISKARHLRSREHYASHFYGVQIQAHSSGMKWGVLLLDSWADTCPFPDESSRSHIKFNERFSGFATTLSHILT